VLGGLALPPLRRRLGLSPRAVLAGAALAPLSAAVVWPRSRGRDVAVCAMQMYVYLAAYKMPHDDPDALAARVRIDYPIALDRAIGLGELPTTRLQRSLHHDGSFSGLEKVLVWAHWVWFATPHATLLYIRARDRSRFARAAVLTYAVFDLGACLYWIVPTAPPWYAASVAGRRQLGGEVAVRRMMAEYGEFFWKDGWGPLYDVFGGNPVAAMPSLHFATSLMAALLLAETGPLAGAVGFGYTATLGFALIYLGEHYVIDLIGGAALTVLVRRAGPRAGPLLRRFGSCVAALEQRALGGDLGS